VFDADPADFVSALEKALPRGADYGIRWVSGSKNGEFGISAGCIGDMLTAVQSFLDDYVLRTGCRIDYIHDDDSVLRLARGERCIGLILPAMDKSELFSTITAKGVFPRKSFSVGHAKDKRYYLECRGIL
jgi:hypothetical protein